MPDLVGEDVEVFTERAIMVDSTELVPAEAELEPDCGESATDQQLL